MAPAVSRPALFNSLLETGIRAVVVLDAVYPRAFSVTQIAWFDHLVVHTKDIAGPPSLHPDVPQRSGELLVRRRLVEDSLTLMRRLRLVELEPDQHAGILYRASGDASGIVEHLQTDYALQLRECAKWLAKEIFARTPEAFEALVAERIGRWRIEFQGLDARPESYP